MKILIIDDDADKLRKLIAVLTGVGVSRSDIDVSRSAVDAMVKLRGGTYDIAILDLLLPARDEDDARLETSLDLLRDIDERSDVRKPSHLIGFTAYSEAEAQARPHFARSLWTIVKFDQTSSAWEEQFRRVLNYVQKSVESRPSRAYGVDVCVVTALQDPELRAIHEIPWSWEPAEPMDDSTFVKRGSFTSEGHEYRVLAACAPRMGNVAAALLSARIIERYSPRFLAMAGICGGIKNKVNLGDVVLFSPCWEWASGKVVPDDEAGSYLEPAPHQISVAEYISARAELLRADSAFWLELRNRFPVRSDTLPKLVVAPAASGPSVVAHTDYTESLKLQHRKLTAIDMEAYGVMASALSASVPKPTAFALKAVCDFADEEKDERWQGYAAYISAQTIRAFFERNMPAIRELAGT